MLADLIERQERSLLTTEVRTSPEHLRRLLTDDFFEIGSSGRMLYRTEDAATMDLGEIHITLSDFSLDTARRRRPGHVSDRRPFHRTHRLAQFDLGER